jgi:hypothetical protein
MVKSFLIGGKLGDFIHGLSVCKYLYDINGEKNDIYISNLGDPFEQGLEYTYEDLRSVIYKQPWVNSFTIYKGQPVDFNLSNFRSSVHLYNHNFLEMYFNTYIPGNLPPLEFEWINVEKNTQYSESLIVNRSINKPGGFPNDALLKYKEISKTFSDRYFVCFERFQYDAFPLKEDFQLLLVSNLYEYFKIINSGKLFIGNQSAPFAFASSMNVPRILEILRSPERVFYAEDSKYYKNFNII